MCLRKEASKTSAFQNILSRRKILHNCYESHDDIPTLSPSPVAPGPFAFAGIWDSWKRPDGTRLETFALVTTEPNELVAQIHDRLALILHPRDYDRWLGIGDNGAIRGLRSISFTPTIPLG